MRYTQQPDISELEKLRPAKGDPIECQGIEYIAEEIGMKYIIARVASSPTTKRWLKTSDTRKVIPASPPAEAEFDLAIEFPGLKPAHS